MYIFPGMNPFLEAETLWPLFHHQLVTCLYQSLLPGLVDRYRARVGQRKYATEVPLFTSVLREEHVEEYIEIRQRSDSRLISLIDVVSPRNKLTDQGRQVVLAKRGEARNCSASIVEIDLILQGKPIWDYSRQGLPEWDYAVTVTRSIQPDRFEIYTATLQKRLPHFRLPLASDDRDTVVDLHSILVRSFDQGGFAEKIDYTNPPATTLNPKNAEWLEAFLKQHKLK